jgi:hypothetical protein
LHVQASGPILTLVATQSAISTACWYGGARTIGVSMCRGTMKLAGGTLKPLLLACWVASAGSCASERVVAEEVQHPAAVWELPCSFWLVKFMAEEGRSVAVLVDVGGSIGSGYRFEKLSMQARREPGSSTHFTEEIVLSPGRHEEEGSPVRLTIDLKGEVLRIGSAVQVLNPSGSSIVFAKLDEYGSVDVTASIISLPQAVSAKHMQYLALGYLWAQSGEGPPVELFTSPGGGDSPPFVK